MVREMGDFGKKWDEQGLIQTSVTKLSDDSKAPEHNPFLPPKKSAAFGAQSTLNDWRYRNCAQETPSGHALPTVAMQTTSP
mmetsp:Transcript_54463/g.90522  ORF Transcript_54463/g.90522 Transcript_54463/m.90522 type:complete len:81 (+) Transcript_54463:289-531(+)